MDIEQRCAIERQIVEHLITIMDQHGWKIFYIDDGGYDIKPANLAEAIEAVFAVDECTIGFTKNSMRRAVFIVLGNDGYDCIADHSCSNPEIFGDDFERIIDKEVWPLCDQLEDENT